MSAKITNEELKAARNKLGMSQSELSEAINTPKRTIQDWESGKTRIPGVVAICIELMLEKDAALMEYIIYKTAQNYKQHQPTKHNHLTRQA